MLRTRWADAIPPAVILPKTYGIRYDSHDNLAEHTSPILHINFGERLYTLKNPSLFSTFYKELLVQ